MEQVGNDLNHRLNLVAHVGFQKDGLLVTFGSDEESLHKGHGIMWDLVNIESAKTERNRA